MTTNTLYTEVMAANGPTGRFEEALEVVVVDYGGNELARATSRHGLDAALKRWSSMPTRVRVLLTGKSVPADEVDPDGIV